MVALKAYQETTESGSYYDGGEKETNGCCEAWSEFASGQSDHLEDTEQNRNISGYGGIIMQSNLKTNKVLKNLVYLAFLTTGESAEQIYKVWHTHLVFKDYKNPGIHVIEEWINEFWEESK